MEKKLVVKMIKNCLKQYYQAADGMPVGEHELEGLTTRILRAKEEEPALDLYEAVNDAVYEFLTN